MLSPLLVPTLTSLSRAPLAPVPACPAVARVRLTLALSATLLFGCGATADRSLSQAEPQAQGTPGPAAPSADAPPAVEAAEPGGVAGNGTSPTVEASTPAAAAMRAPTQRKLIRDGDVSLTVKKWDPFEAALRAQVKDLGGYLGNTEARRSDVEVTWAKVTVRLPSERFDDLVAWIQGQGVATSVNVRTQDITQEYTDLEARITNARKLEARLLELLAERAARLTDVLEVERELARVREGLETMEGRRRLFDHLSALSTLNLEVTVTERYVPPVHPGLGTRVVQAFVASLRAMGDFGAGLLVVGAAVGPWLILLGGGAFLSLRAAIRWSRRRRSPSVP